MTDSKVTIGPSYALGQLWRALQAAATHTDADVRARAESKRERWTAVLEGMAAGKLDVGSRTPVVEAPAWVTLEVVHGGFATGRYAAEGELLDHERALLAEIPADVPGATDRERLNLWFLSDAGLAVLRAAVRHGRCRIDVPEEGALPVVAWLLEHGRNVEALQLVGTLRSWLPRLRFYPRLEERPRSTGATVHLRTAAEVAGDLRTVRTPDALTIMHASSTAWGPLYDRLVALWLDTVEGALPEFERNAEGTLARAKDGQPITRGGWPCRRWPVDWAERREAVLADHAVLAKTPGGRHAAADGNFVVLLDALRKCPSDSKALTGRDVGRIRRRLAATLSRHGAPGSRERTELRRVQAEVAARPTFAAIAGVLADRLGAYPSGRGVPQLDPVIEAIRLDESETVPVPRHFVRKTMRALEAPIEELVALRVIGSAEVLAIVLPQMTARIAAAGIADPQLRALYEQIYAAFRRRRSLLLLDLAHQVRLEELPWIAALESDRDDDLDVRAQARQALEQVSELALASFPHTILPNPLVREMTALAKRAGVEIPFVEEVAADIFMGTFTRKWADAAVRAATMLRGTLYARYYDLPLPTEPELQRVSKHGRTITADGFARLCGQRTAEAGTPSRWSVAGNGTVLEQSQILTTHNLAVLCHALGLDRRIRDLAPELAERNFAFIERRLAQPIASPHARLQAIKNCAYAWRQAIFFVSLVPQDVAATIVSNLEHSWSESDELRPIAAGLRHVLDGGRFDTTGRGIGHLTARRFLGWSVGPHWLGS